MTRLLSIVLSTCLLVGARAEDAPKRNDGEKTAIGMQMQSLGHGLWISGSFQSQESGWSEHRCYIGYRHEPGEGAFKIVPIIHLPTLTNESYEITIEGKQLIVTKSSKKEEVFRIELERLRVPKEKDHDPFADGDTAEIKIDTKFVKVGSGTEELSFDWIVRPLSSEQTGAEQDGAGPPANPPESKPEGKEKPKHESKVRP